MREGIRSTLGHSKSWTLPGSHHPASHVFYISKCRFFLMRKRCAGHYLRFLVCSTVVCLTQLQHEEKIWEKIWDSIRREEARKEERREKMRLELSVVVAFLLLFYFNSVGSFLLNCWILIVPLVLCFLLSVFCYLFSVICFLLSVFCFLFSCDCVDIAQVIL